MQKGDYKILFTNCIWNMKNMDCFTVFRHTYPFIGVLKSDIGTHAKLECKRFRHFSYLISVLLQNDVNRNILHDILVGVNRLGVAVIYGLVPLFVFVSVNNFCKIIKICQNANAKNRFDYKRIESCKLNYSRLYFFIFCCLLMVYSYNI